ncbi:MAG: hypothetical protein WB952_24745 [Terriglobales bacterium]
MQPIDLSDILSNAPRECWLALTEDGTKLLGWSETMAGAVEKARAAGVEEPLVYWAPVDSITRVL